MGDSSIFEECITHGPWGNTTSPLGKDWIYMPEGFIKKITIYYSNSVHFIGFQSITPTDETQCSSFGCNYLDGKPATICIQYPHEYLTSISGSFGSNGYEQVVTSLYFHTNQRSYGPYGSITTGTGFKYNGKGGMIIGFHGRAGNYVNAIGIYVMPKLQALYRNSCKDISRHQLFKTGLPREAGPWGGYGGKVWDDGVFSHVKQARVYYVGESSKLITALQFEYVKRDGKSFLSEMHGGTGGTKTELVNLDGTVEYLIGVSGFYGPVEGDKELNLIASITFHTNLKMYGPYGQESSEGYVYFTSTASPGKVVGFHGRKADFLTAIGVHMEYL